MSSQHGHRPQARPRTYKVTLKSILSLPYRLCNPPPAVGKVRSCSVTPVANVQLNDILDRKHLPPLGMKDFEEWLLYVERSPENLYFILWLRDYTTKYNEWALPSNSQVGSEAGPDWPFRWSAQLAMFFARAKETFVKPNSDFELDLPSDILAPFHVSNPHPPPATFKEVEYETRKMLQRSLERFVRAAYTNGGNNRVLCGALGGIGLALAGTIPLITFNIVRGKSRWLRLAALPSLWLGLTALLCALNGICLLVYMMGDLRQLRKFELSRPSISKPRPLVLPRQRQMSSSAISGLISFADPTSPTDPTTPITPITPTDPSAQLPPLSIVSPVPAAVHFAKTLSSSSISSYGTSVASSSRTTIPRVHDEIYISPAYVDEGQVEGPATSSAAPNIAYTYPSKRFYDNDRRVNPYPSTAAFIHPFYTAVEDGHDASDDVGRRPEDHQPIAEFDFDFLPRWRPITPSPSTPAPAVIQPESHVLVIEREAQAFHKFKRSLRGFISYLQYKCNIYKWQVVTGRPFTDIDLESSSADLHNPQQPHRVKEKGETKVRTQFKLVRAVPAFASPLTRVMSPIIVRGQWEIVVRSGAIALLISWVVLGIILAVPVAS